MWQSIFSISAEDRVGHVTQVSSDAVIIDTTTPTIGHLAIGTITQERFVSAKELPVHWDGVEDKESGIKHLEVSVSLLIVQSFVFRCQCPELRNYCVGQLVEQ